MRWLLLLMALLLSTPACSKSKSGPSKETGTTGGPTPTPVSYECKSDAECTLSCTLPGDCCGKGCDCDAAYHVDEIQAIRKKNRELCEGKQLDCPQYSCAKPTYDLVAYCEAGDCKARKVPHAPPSPPQDRGFPRPDGSPDPLSCESAEDCIGDTIPNESGCCQEPTQVRAHTRAYRSYMQTWRKDHCSAAPPCPPPPNPAEPAECLFEMDCVESLCVNSCRPQ